MSAVLEVVIVAASLGVSLTAPPFAGSAEPERGARVSVVESGAGRDGGVAAYVRERAAATWAGGAHAGRALEVRLEATAGGLVVGVVEGGEGWAQRTFALEPGDALALRLAVWLFVRSTVTRALAEAPLGRAGVAPDHDPGAAPGGPSSGTDGGGDPDAAPSTGPAGTATAGVARDREPQAGEPASGASPAAAPAPLASSARDGAPGGVDLTDTHTSPSESALDTILPPTTDAPVPPGAPAGAWVVRPALLATAVLGPGRLWSAGLALTFEAPVRAPGAVWGEVGYAVSPGSPGLLVHGLPVGLAVGVRPRWLESLQLGFAGWAEPKLASSGGRWSLAVGAGAGPAVRWTGPVLGRTAVLRLAWVWGLRRQRYQTDAGTREDAPSTVALALGMVLP